MALNLPAVISAMAQGASIVSSLSANPDISDPIVNIDLLDVKKVIIMISRDVTKDDKKLLASFGIVKSYDSMVHLNLPLSGMQFDYLFVDMREAEDRLFYQKSVQGDDRYHQVYYKFSWESDMGLHFESQFSDFPPIQASKLAFDLLLCSQPIPRPSACLAFLEVLGKCGTD